MTTVSAEDDRELFAIYSRHHRRGWASVPYEYIRDCNFPVLLSMAEDSNVYPHMSLVVELYQRGYIRQSEAAAKIYGVGIVTMPYRYGIESKDEAILDICTHLFLLSFSVLYNEGTWSRGALQRMDHISYDEYIQEALAMAPKSRAPSLLTGILNIYDHGYPEVLGEGKYISITEPSDEWKFIPYSYKSLRGKCFARFYQSSGMGYYYYSRIGENIRLKLSPKYERRFQRRQAFILSSSLREAMIDVLGKDLAGHHISYW